MSTKALGRLQKVELREAWTSECADFTPWLASQENLKLLGDTIGIELELDSQEKEVGPFRADILCKDTATDDWVLIENQLERTDHTHLGQLLTYAAGLNVVTVVWIAQRFTDEHRAALDWLNERTDERVRMFGLEIELWRIGDSPLAPKFNVVSKPNEWARTIQDAANVKGTPSEHRQIQLRFWQAFREYIEARSTLIRCQKPGMRHFNHHSLGRSGAYLASVISGWDAETGKWAPEIRAELVLDGVAAKEEFTALEKQKADIQQAVGFPLTWWNPESKTMCRIYVRQKADFLNEQLWPVQFDWLRQHLEPMHKTFAPLVKALRP